MEKFLVGGNGKWGMIIFVCSDRGMMHGVSRRRANMGGVAIERSS